MTIHQSRQIAASRWPAGAAVRTGVLAAGLLLAAAAAGRAQNPGPDPRWQAWLGCWRPDGGTVPADAKEHLVCVLPVPGTPNVEIAAVADSQIVSRDTVAATGERRALSREGCDGWQRATWSSEGQRVYLHAEFSCSGGLKRATSGLMAITPDGHWLDAQGVALRGETAVHVVQYADAGLPRSLPAGIAEALVGRGLAVGMAREAASAPATLADVVEASHAVEPALIEAWLAGAGQGFRLDAKKLVALSDSGVSDRVIDVMVALSYPKAFAVNPASGLDEFAPVSAGRREPVYSDSQYAAYGNRYAQPLCYSPWAWDYYGQWGSPYGCGYYSGFYSPFGYAPYGYAPYGYGYSPWFGGYGWNYGGGTVVIVGGSGGPPAPHGRLVKGRGYTPSGQPSGGGNQAHPRGAGAPSPDRSGEPRSSGGSSASSGSSSSRPSSPSPPPSSGSSEGRTAKPRP